MPAASFTGGLAKLKPSGVQWAAKAARSQHQVYRTESGCGWPGQCAELKSHFHNSS